MKKILTLIAMFAVALSSWALNVGDTFNSSNGDYTYEVKKVATASTSGEVYVQKYNNATATSSKIAYSIIGTDSYIYNITGVAAYAYDGRSNLTSITLGGNVEFVGDFAFRGTGITAISLNSSLKNYGPAFLAGCEKLATIEVDALNSRFSVYDTALYTKDRSTLIAVPATQKIYLFANELEHIGGYAFANSCIERIEIPYGVVSMEGCPFYNAKCKFISIPSSVTSFSNDGNSFIKGCTNLEGIFINTKTPPFVNVDDFIEESLRKQTNLYYDRSYYTAYNEGDWFNYKNGFRTNFDEERPYDVSIKNIEYSVAQTEPLEVYGVKYDGAVKIVTGYHKGNHSGDINIPNYIILKGKLYAVVTICDRVFYKCNVTSVTGGDNIRAIGSQAFGNCTQLKSVSFPNVANIYSSAFEGCSSLTSFALSKYITNIGTSAFAETGLTGDVVIPYGCRYLGGWIYYGTKVKRIFIPNVIEVEGSVIAGMTNLTDAYINNDLDGKYDETELVTVAGVPSTCVLHLGTNYSNGAWTFHFNNRVYDACDFTYGTAPSSAFSSNYRVTVLSKTPFTEDGVEYDGTAEYTYSAGMGNVQSFTLSDYETNKLFGINKRYKMVKIGDGCFKDAINLTSIDLTKMPGLKEIGKEAFTGSGVTQITVPAGVSADRAFFGAKKLKDLTMLDDKLQGFGYYDFGDNASDFHCYVSYKLVAKVVKNVEYYLGSGNATMVNPWVLSHDKTVAMGVGVPVDFASSGVNAYVVTGNNMGTSTTGTVATTAKVNAVPAGTGVILTDLTPGKLYKFQRPATTPAAPAYNGLVANPLETEVAVMPSSGNYVWNSSHARFEKPELKTYIESGSAYYVPNVTPSFNEIYLDILPKGSTGGKGDVNGDGKVDVADINVVIDIILELDDASKYGGRADVDKDGKVDVADINAIIDIILAQ